MESHKIVSEKGNKDHVKKLLRRIRDNAYLIFAVTMFVCVHAFVIINRFIEPTPRNIDTLWLLISLDVIYGSFSIWLCRSI